MIFQQWQQVLDGTKAQTRRLVKTNEDTIHVAPGYGELPIECVYTKPDYKHKWTVGQTLAVQPGQGKKSVGRIRITKIRRERLGDISEEDCLAEGVIRDNMATLDGQELVNWLCPICMCGEDWVYAGSKSTYACLWNHCGGNWERDRNKDAWILDFELVEEE